MSKYFDRLIQMDEGLKRELDESTGGFRNNFEFALDKYVPQGWRPADALVNAFTRWMNDQDEFADKYIDDIHVLDFAKWLVSEPEEKYLTMEDGGDDSTIPVPADQVSDDQKKEILKDKGVDPSVTKDMTPEELDGALKVADEDLKAESGCGEFVLRIEDNDLDLHGYVEMKGQSEGRKLQLTDEEGGAAIFQSREEAEEERDNICMKFHYDPDTVSIETICDVSEPGADDGEGWISLDPANSDATTI